MQLARQFKRQGLQQPDRADRAGPGPAPVLPRFTLR
jgi:hypothetical protein